MTERLYGGYTIDEINEKFYIHFNGEENRGRLNDISGKLSKNWQIISPKYTYAKAKLDEHKNTLRRMEEQLKLNMDQTRLKLIKEDRGLPKNQRLSDKARETYAIGENYTADVKVDFDVIHESIDAWKEEVMVWHEVRQNLRFVADQIKNAQISLAVEAKHTRGYEHVIKADAVSAPVESPSTDEFYKKYDVECTSKEKEEELPF